MLPDLISLALFVRAVDTKSLRLLEQQAVTQVEPMRDGRLQSVQIGKRLVQPRVGVAHPRVQRLEALDVARRSRARPRRFVLRPQLVENRISHAAF